MDNSTLRTNWGGDSATISAATDAALRKTLREQSSRQLIEQVLALEEAKAKETMTMKMVAGGAHTGLQVDPSLISGVMTSFMRRQQSELSALSHSQLVDRALAQQREDRAKTAHRAARNVNNLRAQHLSAGAAATGGRVAPASSARIA